jgi:hypothetical protein
VTAKVQQLRSELAPSPIFLAYQASDLAIVFEERTRTLKLMPRVQFEDYTVRSPFAAPAAEALRDLIVSRMERCKGLVCVITRPIGLDDWTKWQIGQAQRLGLPVVVLALADALNLVNLPREFRGIPIVRGSLLRALRALEPTDPT